MKFLKLWISIACLCLFVPVFAQSDTIHLTLQDAEKLFLQNNLSLIAEKYNIDINKAAIKQAKIWDNPNFTVASNIYDGTKIPFNHSKNDLNGGQIDMQWSQLFKIGKQRKKLSTLLTDNADISEQQFNDLLNSLRYALHTDFYAVAGLVQNRKLYEYELSALQPLLVGMDMQLQMGNISVKDNIRIKALEYNIKSDLAENEKQLADLESQLHELTHSSVDTFIYPVMKFDSIPNVSEGNLVLDSLVEIAKQNRPDFKVAELQATLQQHNLSYQKSLAVPDLTVGLEYDKENSCSRNYLGFNVSVPLPIFNRNQVNVQLAKIGIEQQKAQNNVLEAKIRNDIFEALQQLSLSIKMENSQSKDFKSQYDNMLDKMVDSYKQKQLNLVEFIDFLDAYKETKETMNHQIDEIRKSIEDLNFACGTSILEN